MTFEWELNSLGNGFYRRSWCGGSYNLKKRKREAMGLYSVEW